MERSEHEPEAKRPPVQRKESPQPSPAKGQAPGAGGGIGAPLKAGPLGARVERAGWDADPGLMDAMGLGDGGGEDGGGAPAASGAPVQLKGESAQAPAAPTAGAVQDHLSASAGAPLEPGFA